MDGRTMSVRESGDFDRQNTDEVLALSLWTAKTGFRKEMFSQ